MRAVLIAFFALAGVAAIGQVRSNPGSVLYPGALPGPNHGTVLYPATGQPPSIPGAITDTTFPGRLSRNILGYPPFPGSEIHQRHPRTLIVPYPVFYGSYSTNAYDAAAYAPVEYLSAPAPPSVVINQTFVNGAPQSQAPEETTGLKLYSATPPAAGADQPTLYLIAFKDHNIVPALAYWLEGKTLNYISVEHSANQVSLDLVDREMSQQLNDERKVDFRLR